MEDKDKIVRFNLIKISTEQFAIAGDIPPENAKIAFTTNLQFKSSSENRIVVAFTKFNFEYEGKPFLIVEGSCQFNIHPEDWQSFENKENDTIVIPKALLTHLAMLTVGTTRGILHAKTENTPHNRFFIPPVNLNIIIKEDLLLKPNPEPHT
jgi:hypothetical protein